MATKENITNIRSTKAFAHLDVPLVYQIEIEKSRHASGNAIDVLKSRISKDMEQQLELRKIRNMPWTFDKLDLSNVVSQTVRETVPSLVPSQLTRVHETSNWRLIGPPYTDQDPIPPNHNAGASKATGYIYINAESADTPDHLNIGITLGLRSPKKVRALISPMGDFALYVSNPMNEPLNRFQNGTFGILSYAAKAVTGGWSSVGAVAAVVINLPDIPTSATGRVGQLGDLTTLDSLNAGYSLFPLIVDMEANTDYQVWVGLSQKVGPDLNGNTAIHSQFNCNIRYVFVSTMPL